MLHPDWQQRLAPALQVASGRPFYGANMTAACLSQTAQRQSAALIRLGIIAVPMTLHSVPV
ncbi:hypothetical protein QVN42_00755 [Yersinia nurmii]|uniref:Uncharacterized protein n=1 Tax=Yersinia nurmii TaxID=685706 RepID=A0AAW7K605_9GAMM|nr:hypothetical protein [Yersinia nurmii]CND90930.1 Uncharacterised protein [Yersinia nurmii]